MPLRYRIGKPSLWLQGLLIVLALLGHDLLMASPAPVAAMAATTDELHHHPTHALVDVPAALPLGHPESPHPSVCGIGGTALFPPVDQLGVADLSTLAVMTACHVPASVQTRTFLSEEPHWPPGTRRALLQVYRI